LGKLILLTPQNESIGPDELESLVDKYRKIRDSDDNKVMDIIKENHFEPAKRGYISAKKYYESQREICIRMLYDSINWKNNLAHDGYTSLPREIQEVIKRHGLIKDI
jgi:hypothetical protein